MNATFGRALVIALPVLILLGLSWSRFIRTHTWSARLQLFGASCLVVVVLAHIAEAWHWFQGMGWGERHTVGHYIDLVSAAAGVTLLSLAFVLAYVRRAG